MTNPPQPPHRQPQQPPGSPMSGRDTYNLVTDTVAGPNLRMKDNLYQGLFILVCLILGVGVGALIGGLGGAVVGALIGLVVGLLASGIFLMIYRGVQHGRGRHE